MRDSGIIYTGKKKKDGVPKVCKQSVDEQCSTYCSAGTQFRSCLDQHLGLRLSESDYEYYATILSGKNDRGLWSVSTVGQFVSCFVVTAHFHPERQGLNRT